MKKQKYKYEGKSFTIEYRWKKDGCDYCLEYKNLGNWQHFGLVCTESLKYVWGREVELYNFAASLKQGKNKLLDLCAESRLPFVVNLERT